MLCLFSDIQHFVWLVHQSLLLRLIRLVKYFKTIVLEFNNKKFIFQPKSRKKRSVLKSVIFVDKHNDSFPGTPKRRNSSRRYKATPKASLAQLGSDIEDNDDVFG